MVGWKKYLVSFSNAKIEEMWTFALFFALFVVKIDAVQKADS